METTKKETKGQAKSVMARTAVEEMKTAGFNWETLSGLAQNWVRWRCFVDGLSSGMSYRT